MNISLQGRGGVMAWLQRCAGCVALLGLLAPLAAGAAPLAEPDARAVRQVIEAQLEAFAADDAERAFSYASPAIRAQFGDANSFMGMVRGGYPMVLRPAAVSFFQAQTVDGAITTYVLEQQAGVGWRINGCVVVADSGQSLT
jgi:hypothetical protein